MKRTPRTAKSEMRFTERDNDRHHGRNVVKLDTGNVSNLLQQALAGDNNAWNALIKRFSGLVHRVARQYGLNPADTSDVSQTVWLRLYENAGRIREPDRLGTWVAVVARRECAIILRRTSAEDLIDNPDMLDGPAGARGHDHQLIVRERNAMLWKAVEELPARGRSLIILLATDPLVSYQRAAWELGMAVGSVGPTRRRCLSLLRANPAVQACRE
jgi:RNA polymerase sigma factor (sigma-70 family)